MPDSVDPSQPPPSPVSTPPLVASEPDTTGRPTSTGLPSNVAATIACIPLVGGIVFYILEKHDSFVRFYAMQSIIFGIAWILISIASAIVGGFFHAIPGLGPIFVVFWNLITWLISLALFVIMVVAMIKAFTNVRWDIPYIGPIARKQVGESAV